jgi:hypothetical protein
LSVVASATQHGRLWIGAGLTVRGCATASKSRARSTKSRYACGVHLSRLETATIQSWCQRQFATRSGSRVCQRIGQLSVEVRKNTRFRYTLQRCREYKNQRNWNMPALNIRTAQRYEELAAPRSRRGNGGRHPSDSEDGNQGRATGNKPSSEPTSSDQLCTPREVCAWSKSQLLPQAINDSPGQRAGLRLGQLLFRGGYLFGMNVMMQRLFVAQAFDSLPSTRHCSTVFKGQSELKPPSQEGFICVGGFSNPLF